MKHVLVTGANRGIGLGHTRAFAAKGVHVFAAVRSPNEAAELHAMAATFKGMVSVLRYDAAMPDAGAQLRAAVGDTAIDLLFANAGVLGGSQQSFGSVDADDVLQVLRVNSVVPLKLVETLADNVARSSSKIVALQSSQLGSITNNAAGGLYGHRARSHRSPWSSRCKASSACSTSLTCSSAASSSTSTGPSCLGDPDFLERTPA